MRRAQAVSLCWLVLALGAFALQAQAGPQVLRVPMTTEAPRIDGNLDEMAWQSAAVAAGFLLEQTALVPTQPTTVYLLCDAAHLYLGVRCAESDLAGMTVAADKEKGGVWSDDFVEIHIDVTNNKRRFEQFAVNPDGVTTQDAMAQHARIAAARGQTEWRVEMALDLADLGVRHLGAPVRWALNLGRVRHNGRRDEETSVWSGAPGSVDDAALMGEMIVGPPGSLAVEGLDLEQNAAWGAGNRFAVRVTNFGAPQWVRVAARPISAAGEEPEQSTATRLESGETRAAPGQFAVTSLDPEQRVGISVKDGSGRLLYRVWRPVTLRPLLALEPLRPRYRGLILPGDEKCEFRLRLGLTPQALAGVMVEMQVAAAPWASETRVVSRLTGEREAPGGEAKARDLPREGEILYSSFTPRAQVSNLSFPASALPYGDSALRVRCLTLRGRELAAVSLPLRRLTEAELAALPTHVDEHNRLIVGGKPFFPLGWYGGHNLQHLAEIADSPFNCILDYGINHLPLDEIRAYLDAAQARGLKLIYCMNDLYPAATFHQQIGPWRGNQEMARGVVSTFRDHPAIIAWYLNDELPTRMIPDLMRYYDLVRASDPGHPTFIVHFVRDILADFVPTTDILGIDVYPVPTRPLTRVSEMTDAGIAATGGRKPVWMVLQAFAWYQYRTPEDPTATGGRGRIPTESELRTGRAPTREEARCMTYLALTHGAMGLIYYCYYDLRVLPQYQEMWAWMKEIAAEVRELSPVLLSPATLPVVVQGDTAKLHALLKEYEGRWYLLAVNGEPTAAAAQFVLPAEAQSVRVLFEERAAAVSGRTLADEFGPYAVRVYEITPAVAPTTPAPAGD